jgi:predicted dehydrogenase
MANQDKPDKKNLTRKEFCRTAAFAAGGGLMLSSLPIGASAFAAGNDTLKIAVVGCGGRGTGAVNQALTADSGVQLVAMADAFRDRLDESHSNLSQRYGDTDQMNVPEENKFTGFDGFRHAIDLADVVILATPPGFRPQHFEYAVAQNKHVFMEKPVATDAPGVRRVLAAGRRAQANNLNVVVGLQRHYQNNYREVLNRIDQNQVGKIQSGQVYWNSGGVWVREREPDQTEMEYQMRNWYYFNWLCGDHILEQHIHNISIFIILMWLTGLLGSILNRPREWAAGRYEQGTIMGKFLTTILWSLRIRAGQLFQVSAGISPTQWGAWMRCFKARKEPFILMAVIVES